MILESFIIRSFLKTYNFT